MASLVPEPMEKCAVCAASPSSTTLPCRQRSLRTVPKLTHRELFSSTSWPSRMSANSSPDQRGRLLVGLAGSQAAAASAAKPARRHTLSFISTMNVLPLRVVRVAVDLHHAVRRLADVELERVEHLVRAQPHVLAVPDVQVGRNVSAYRAPHGGVDAVRGHHQVVRPAELGHVRRAAY